ncbi:MAG: Hpt domain-containing protein [Phycisphaerae bacterium]
MPDKPDPPRDPISSDLVRQDADYADIVEQFLQEMPQRMQDIESAISGENYENLQRLAHQLKGSGGGYGYPALTEKAAKLEQLAVDQELTSCRTALEGLRGLVSRLVVGLDQK